MMSSEITITYLNIILYALSYQLQRPIEPFLVRSLIHKHSNNSHSDNEESTSNQTYGRLTSFFSLIQTIGSPLVGMLLDRIGPRRTSILVYTASAGSYWLLAQATSPMGLYASKVPTLFQHAFLVGQATVSCSFEDDDDDEDVSSARRAAALGRMTTAYTIGATIGPALGGYLASTDLYAGARLAVGGSLLSVLLSMIYLKDHRGRNLRDTRNNAPCSKGDDSEQQEANQHDHSTFLQSVKHTLSFLHHPKLGPLLFMKLINGISSSAFTTILPLILTNQLQFSPSNLGYFMSISSMSVAVFAAVGISPAMSFFGNYPDRLAFWGMGCRVVSLLTFGVLVSQTLSVNHLPGEDSDVSSNAGGLVLVLTLACVVISLASHVHATSLTTLTTGSVPSHDRGTILGLEHGIFSMARIVGPPLGTALLSRPSWFGSRGNVTIWGVVVMCVGMDFVVMMLLRVWSMRQYARMKGGVEVYNEELSKGLAKERNDHEHSD
ncbi:hypothetical protein HJC23_002079 [Cyclotella cryptica]|uniref:Major facilitator superfamily (MFS) profile domain-containing protein n=1 Tax=Cyclotella cryptica TaxID=29204 RepID=A0ABD3Q5S3_9STRA|eukprot:CCRYP_008326-RA/>CCRYP_008326-RA protein AED:0.46 eAED:0.46 QI:0/-1/0/1/-1/1/1/0/492